MFTRTHIKHANTVVLLPVAKIDLPQYSGLAQGGMHFKRSERKNFSHPTFSRFSRHLEKKKIATRIDALYDHGRRWKQFWHTACTHALNVQCSFCGVARLIFRNTTTFCCASCRMTYSYFYTSTLWMFYTFSGASKRWRVMKVLVFLPATRYPVPSPPGTSSGQPPDCIPSNYHQGPSHPPSSPSRAAAYPWVPPTDACPTTSSARRLTPTRTGCLFRQ